MWNKPQAKKLMICSLVVLSLDRHTLCQISNVVSTNIPTSTKEDSPWWKRCLPHHYPSTNVIDIDDKEYNTL